MENEERNALFESRLPRSSTDSNSNRRYTNKSNGGGNGDFGNQPPQQQQQQQQLSWEQVRGNIDVAERQRGLRSVYESVEVGRETLERLEEQEESLERSEMVLDSTRYAIERSARLLRGMTFWGKIRNAFSDDPQVPQQRANRASAGGAAGAAGAGGAAGHGPQEARGEPTAAGYGNDIDVADERGRDDTPVEGFICPDCRKRFFAADALVAHFGSAHTNAGADDARGGGGGGGVESGGIGAAGWGGTTTRIGGTGGGGGGDSLGGTTAPGSSLRDQLFGARGEKVAAQQADSGGFTRGGGGDGVIAKQKAVMASQDAYLESVGEAVKELGLLGRNIGASLDGQGATLDRVAEKTTEVDDRTAFVTRKAARQAQSSKPKKPTFVMSLALQEVSTGLYLAVTGEEVVLQGRELRNVCRFEAWERQHGIIGLKSGVTRRWLGQTFLGYLRVSGTSFGKNYEWQADLRRERTTLVCCSANWGAGGYLSVRVANGGGGGASVGTDSAAAVADSAELGLVDATLANKHRAAVFRLVNCDDYTPQPFVGGRLMRNPGPPGGGGGRGAGAGEQPPRNAGWQ